MLIKLKNISMIIGLLFLSITSIAEQAPKYEFRAAWIATVLRLDWPKSSTITTQKSQLISILDGMQKANMNAGQMNSGVYLYQIRSSEMAKVKKCILMK